MRSAQQNSSYVRKYCISQKIRISSYHPIFEHTHIQLPLLLTWQKMIKERTFKVGNRNWIKLHCYCFYRYRSSNMKRILIQVYEYEIKLNIFSPLCWFVILRRKEMKDDIFVKLNDMGAIMMTTRKNMLIWKNFAAVQSADVYQSASACN